MKKLYAEWCPDVQLYRIFDWQTPHQTIAYEMRTDILAAKKRIEEEFGAELEIENPPADTDTDRETSRQAAEENRRSDDQPRMKQVFILVGDPKTGKSTLGELIQQENTIVIDDFVISNESARDVVCKLYKSNSDYAVIITNDECNLNLLTDRLTFTKISILFVKKVDR